MKLNTVYSCYLKHGYFKVPSYIKEYSLNTIPTSLYMSISVISNHWYLKVDFLGLEIDYGKSIV